MKQDDLQRMLKEASSIMVQQRERIGEVERENEALLAKQAEMVKRIAGYERKEECEKIASLMIDRGLTDPSEYRTRVQELYDGDDDLVVVKQAAEMYVSDNKEGIEFVSSGKSIAKTADERAEERFNFMK